MSTPIRDPHINFAQALVQLARDHGISRFEGSFRLDFDWERHGWNDLDVKINWSAGRHGDDSKIVLSTGLHASVPEIAPNSDRVPSMVYFSEGDFYELTAKKGKGPAFFDRWQHRSADFPQSRAEAFAALDPETQKWISKRWPDLGQSPSDERSAS